MHCSMVSAIASTSSSSKYSWSESRLKSGDLNSSRLRVLKCFIDDRNSRSGLEVGSIQRIQGLDTAHWRFLRLRDRNLKLHFEHSGMDWLSKRKFVIVCHEKVVRIPLEGDEILRVHSERTQGVVKTLMNTKSKEEHEVHLKLVLESLRKEKLYAMFSKYNSKEWNSGDDQLRLRWIIYLMVLADAAESLRDAIRFDYQLSIQCAPFEALCGRKCRLPVLWAEIRESSLSGLERKPLEFKVVDRVLLKVTPWKGVVCFGKKGKLAPRYVGPFEILERIGLVAYRLRLPEELNSVHDTFHESNLKKCLADATLHVPLNEIKVDNTLFFVEEPVEIMDQEIKKLKRKNIALVKVRWNLKHGPEFTWEYEEQMRIKYP
ncbi:hypothetical protein Tco_1110337 [Tanacetum coccineum]|uniref:Tf2-1-like SH3-like domain-containing protein n=1 Tax=Tanacetum coccineum TaxID=301880 RepID=A0ABQ5IL13_9ASTR